MIAFTLWLRINLLAFFKQLVSPIDICNINSSKYTNNCHLLLLISSQQRLMKTAFDGN